LQNGICLATNTSPPVNAASLTRVDSDRPSRLENSKRFSAIGNAVNAVASASRVGTSFVFGYLGGGPLPFELKTPGNEFVLALPARPVVLVMSVLDVVSLWFKSIVSGALSTCLIGAIVGALT
jgi:nucleoside permease NupC